MNPTRNHACLYWGALWLLLLPSLGIPQTNAAASASSAANSPAHVRLPVDLPLDAVKWTGCFWQDRMRRLRDIHLRGVLDGSFMSVENGSTFLNLLRAAKLEQGGAQGSTWSDGDCYLVLDTVARLQAYQPDVYLKSSLDKWIPIIARIQLEDGLVDSWSVLGAFDPTHGKPWRYQIKKGERFHGALHYNTGSLYAFASTLQRATGDGRALGVADRAVRRFMGRNNTVAGPMQWAVPHLYVRTGDVVDLDLPMPVRLLAAHPNVADARGKVAVMRGPVVYCLEGDDVPEGVALEHVRVPSGLDLKPVSTEELGGVIKLTGSLVCSATATAAPDSLSQDPAETALYREARFAIDAKTLAQSDRLVTASLIPYYARLNRKSDYFRIWLPVY